MKQQRDQMTSTMITTLMMMKMMRKMMMVMMVKGSDDIALTFAEAWTSKTVQGAFLSD